jgi:hypothetical protein
MYKTLVRLKRLSKAGIAILAVMITGMVNMSVARADEVKAKSIPIGCKELADRAGLPLTLTPAQAKRAIAYVCAMSTRDPAVARCRVALSL